MEDNNQLKNSLSDAKVEDVAEEEEDCETVTMLDVLEEEQDLEDNAFAVLAGSDDQNCTYLKGYVSRQALYACNTCALKTTSADECSGRSPRAAICLACSYHCHDGHDLIELYTKRNFRCDCGNEKFAENKCKLYSKSSVNELNEYNHNFDGLYCLCRRPYPDPDNDVDDQMIQCVVCEDWYHSRHLKDFPQNEDFAEMICSECMSRLPFLSLYNSLHSKKTNEEKSETNEEIDITSSEDSKQLNSQSVVSSTPTAKSEPTLVCESDSGVETSCDSVVDSSLRSSECKLKALKSSQSTGSSGEASEAVPTFWPLEWRRSLCKCCDCLRLLTQNKCLFLTEDNDMVHHYEREGMQSQTRISDYDKGLSELKKMNRIQSIEYISGFNDLQNSLKEYLKKFAESGKTVREEDIKEFFQGMSSRKRQKVNIPFNCK